MCNVSEMIEDAIKSNKLSWDDGVWEHNCIVLTDAADEWYHPEISSLPPYFSVCKCRKDRSMPQYLKRTNITSIITARPWKLAELTISDTLTRLFDITGVLNYQTLAENVFRVLAEIDCVSEKDRQVISTDFFNKTAIQNIENLMVIPAMCVQFVHQFYVGRLTGGSQCAIYSNMLDMHIVRGLQKLHIKELCTEEIVCKDVPDILRTETTEHLQGNMSLVCSASKLAFTMLTDTCKQSSLVIPENKIKKHITETELDYLLQTGIITKKKYLALCPRTNVPYMFVHKTIQEFLASLYIAMNQTEMDTILHTLHLAYCDETYILDIGQLFIFTCGMCPLAAERMSEHIKDIISCHLESKLQDTLSEFYFPSKFLYEAQQIILNGYTEGEANGRTCVHLTFSHITYELSYILQTCRREEVFKTLIDMNKSNIVSIVKPYSSSGDYLQEVISRSRETLSYLTLSGQGYIDLHGLKLKYFACRGYNGVHNLDFSNMVKCELQIVEPSEERVIFKSMSTTGENIKFLVIEKCTSVDLLCTSLTNMRSLHRLTLFNTKLANTPLHDYLPESIREVKFYKPSVSNQVIRSMLKWSQSRDVCVKCKLITCSISYLSSDEMNVFHWIQQQGGIVIEYISSNGICWSSR
ncbi:uncharacterized protein LOC127853256 [Dreissena polymorpha]|uniref:Uncharacterized protein n=1 Tax=Dreissena polymorpha TaxID=45954 RepID=A0A9D4CHI9_DREPO|nr:uncharacterized protein LOC127853256 [Dreissena polymorpha]XP_052243560.1 uncharacterized protein LOC127853256 [Dreissena polymorpha]KAH3725012.1 hypothetical protein DPMN_050840 [Dreissena polymorpha]